MNEKEAIEKNLAAVQVKTTDDRVAILEKWQQNTIERFIKPTRETLKKHTQTLKDLQEQIDNLFNASAQLLSSLNQHHELFNKFSNMEILECTTVETGESPFHLVGYPKEAPIAVEVPESQEEEFEDEPEINII